MKPIIVLVCILFYVPESAGQVHTNSWSIGISGGHYDYDAGLMFSVGTPYFLNKRFATRITGALRFSEEYHTITNESAPYSGIQTGVVYLVTNKDKVDIYLEGGTNFTFPNKKVSEEHFSIGYYGILGLDFSLHSTKNFGISYFFEMGLAANTAYADTIEGDHSYRYGPIANTGFRFLFAQ